MAGYSTLNIVDIFAAFLSVWGRVRSSRSKFKHLIVRLTMWSLCCRCFWEAESDSDTHNPAKVMEVSDTDVFNPWGQTATESEMEAWKPTDSIKERQKKNETAPRVQIFQQLHLHLTFQAFCSCSSELKMIAVVEKDRPHKVRFICKKFPINSLNRKWIGAAAEKRIP